jgi:hypothetical protein
LEHVILTLNETEKKNDADPSHDHLSPVSWGGHHLVSYSYSHSYDRICLGCFVQNEMLTFWLSFSAGACLPPYWREKTNDAFDEEAYQTLSKSVSVNGVRAFYVVLVEIPDETIGQTSRCCQGIHGVDMAVNLIFYVLEKPIDNLFEGENGILANGNGTEIYPLHDGVVDFESAFLENNVALEGRHRTSRGLL